MSRGEEKISSVSSSPMENAGSATTATTTITAVNAASNNKKNNNSNSTCCTVTSLDPISNSTLPDSTNATTKIATTSRTIDSSTVSNVQSISSTTATTTALLSSTISPAPIPLTGYISNSQPSTPLATILASANGRRLNNATSPGTHSLIEAVEYPFPTTSPSEPGTPSCSKPGDCTVSIASTPSAHSPLSHSPSGQIFQKIQAKTLAVLQPKHSKKPSGSKLSFSKTAKALSLRLPILSQYKPPSPSKDQSSANESPVTPSDRHSSTGTLSSRRVKDESTMGQNLEGINKMPDNPSTRSKLLHRRLRRNGGSGAEGMVLPEDVMQHQAVLSQPDKRQTLGANAPPVMLTPPEEDRQVARHIVNPLPGGSSSNDLGHNATSINTNISATVNFSPENKDERQPNDILESVLLNGFEANEMWLKNALKVLQFKPATEAVRLISHALPCPLASPIRSPIGDPSNVDGSVVLPDSASEAPIIAAAAGYFMLPVSHAQDCTDVGVHNIGTNEGTTSALNIITSAIQRVYGNDMNRIYIHVSHAISSNPSVPKIQSQNLTGSSVNSAATSAGSLVPSAFLTAPSHEGGFFSSTIFNSIVMAQDPVTYAGTPPGFPVSALQKPLPNPALPPFSLHFSLLERYIPPPTIAADSSIFSPYSSVLLDRVVELSPNGGSLLFIYPTKTGAKQFCERYLGKVLDPLLRRLMVLYRLRDDLLWGISRMAAVDQMQEFDGLKERLEYFCRRLSEKAKDESLSGNTFVQNLLLPVFLVHAEKVQVSLNQLSWREWWTAQESARIREVVKSHFQKVSLPSEAAPIPSALNETQGGNLDNGMLPQPTLTTAVQYNGPMDLAREILDGVKASTMRPSSRGMGEAVFASSMVGRTASWPVVGEGSHSNAINPSGKRREDPESIEIGVFILRRDGLAV